MIPTLVLYFLKANAVLLLWAVLYLAALRRLTFYRTNRIFLLGGLVAAAVFPLFQPFLAWPAAAQLSKPLAQLTIVWPAHEQLAEASTTYWPILTALYLVGVAVLLLRLLRKLRTLHALHRASRPAEWRGQPFRALPAGQAPFAFGRHVYVCPEAHTPAELAAVLAHEQAHVAGAHTADVLLAQLVVALAWCNPGVWLLQRAIRENLEFLADEHALHAGVSRKAYQYSLLRLQQLLPGPVPATHFHSLTLKTRIQMMNQKPTRAAQALRYLLVLPPCLALSLLFQTGPLQAHIAPAMSATLLATSAGPAKIPSVGAGQAPVRQAPIAKTKSSKKSNASAKEALIFVNGVEASYADVEKIKPENMASIDVLNEEKAVAKYGERGRKGVLLITTK